MQIEIVNPQKENTDQVGLRLVEELREARKFPAIEKQFVNFLFLRVNPEWRKLAPETKSRLKDEFQAVCNEFQDDFMLFSYSLVGFDSKADLMLWRIGNSMDLIQDMTAKLYQTGLGSYLETANIFLAVTKKMMFVENSTEDRFYVNAGEKKYHFLYPCAKSADLNETSPSDRDAMLEENFMVGRRFPNIKIHLTHAFGFNEQEYLISFETDEPRDFLAFAEEIRQTPESRFSLYGTPVYTCRRRPLMECLDALG